MIRTRGLSYTYATGGAAPLRFPDVDLRQGGTLLLRGRSGTGKSTWLALMAGLRGASGGDLFVAGTQLGTQRGAEIDAWRARNIGFLPQKLYLSSALTVAASVAYGAALLTGAISVVGPASMPVVSTSVAATISPVSTSERYTSALSLICGLAASGPRYLPPRAAGRTRI